MVLATVCLLAGCRSVQRKTASADRPHRRTSQISAERHNDAAQGDAENTVQTVAHEADQAISVPVSIDSDDLFAGADELSLGHLIAAVQARNPSMQAAQAAWSAAAERYPQAIALDDPMLQSMFAPASFASNTTSQSSYYIGMAQRACPGMANENCAGQLATMGSSGRLVGRRRSENSRLAVTARVAFFDFYLVDRELDLNQRNVELMQDFRAAAKAKYESNQVSEQDLSAADLELAKLQQMRLELEQSQRTTMARINTLLHRRPDYPLPAPPAQLTTTDQVPEALVLRELAIEHRPELAALASRIQSEQTAVALACKEYYPDFEFMGRYDSFWTDRSQRPQVGMNMNVPLNKDRRGAAVREAQFKLSKLMAEYAGQQDSVREEVQNAALASPVEPESR